MKKLHFEIKKKSKAKKKVCKHHSVEFLDTSCSSMTMCKDCGDILNCIIWDGGLLAKGIRSVKYRS